MKYDDFELLDGSYEFEATEYAPARTLRVWTQADGQWACVAYDHGPFCRRCKLLDETGAACVSQAIDRMLDVWDEPERGMVFRISEAGKARVETAIRRGGFSAGLDS